MYGYFKYRMVGIPRPNLSYYFGHYLGYIFKIELNGVYLFYVA